jgi:hypothetical protein
VVLTIRKRICDSLTQTKSARETAAELGLDYDAATDAVLHPGWCVEVDVDEDTTIGGEAPHVLDPIDALRVLDVPIRAWRDGTTWNPRTRWLADRRARETTFTANLVPERVRRRRPARTADDLRTVLLEHATKLHPCLPDDDLCLWELFSYAAYGNFERLRRRMLDHADRIERHYAYDEIAEDLRDMINGHDADADRDVYGNDLPDREPDGDR